MGGDSMDQEHGVAQGSKRWNMRQLIVIGLALTVLPSVFGVAILSNVLALGAYPTTTPPITLRQVPAPESTSCTMNATMQAAYAAASQLPIPGGGITQSVWYRTGIEVYAPRGSTFDVIEYYTLTYVGKEQPTASGILLVYCDQTSNQWVTLHPAYDSVTKTWSGTITTTGFKLPVGYDATTPVLISVLQPGKYSAKLWFTNT